jgi:hypothetical protein
MKLTGYALIVVAVAMLACAAGVAIDADLTANGPHPDLQLVGMTLPLVFGLAVGAIGVLLIVYGGSGFFVIREPRVQPEESRKVTNAIHVVVD